MQAATHAPLQRVLVAELHNLHRHGQLAAAEAINQLGVINDAHKLLGRHLYHLLAQQRSAAALHHIKLGVDLIRTVDRDIDGRLLIECCQGDAQGLGLQQQQP